jgi:hypothetical protein
MADARFTYRAMQDVLERIAIAVDDRPASLGLAAAEPYNQNGIPVLEVTDIEHGWKFIVTALPEHD